MGLEDHIAIREDHRRAPLGDVLHGVDGAGKKAIGKRISDQEIGDGEEFGIARVLDAVALQGSQVIRIAELGPKDFEDLPIALGAVGADLALQVTFEVGSDLVIIEEGVVDVEEEDGFGGRHGMNQDSKLDGRYSAGEKTQSSSRQLESMTSMVSGRPKVDRAMEVRRREMASAVAFLRGEAGQWRTTSSRYSRKRISDRAGILGSRGTITLFISDRFKEIRAALIFTRLVPIRILR